MALGVLVVWWWSFSPCLTLSLFLLFRASGVGGGARWIDMVRCARVNSGLICLVRIDFCAVGIVFVYENFN